MAITNPERVATKQDLKDFYDIIFPYLGGNSEAGFTPIGTIIAVMGNSAPTNYLACNGQVVNIADYPELANYFLAQFGSRNKFGGNGTTTFGIPDLRGEFLRGTGTNSHTNQGNGANVGTHQDGTQHLYTRGNGSSYIAGTSTGNSTPSNYDNAIGTGALRYQAFNSTTAADEKLYYTSRPTNTSVLFCIATKNIYLNPSLSFSTEEQVVGTWINGKQIYQKTINVGYFPNATYTEYPHGIANIDKIVGLDVIVDGGAYFLTVNGSYATSGTNSTYAYASTTSITLGSLIDRSSWYAYATIRYTKTT